MKVVNITSVMIKLQFKLPQALISRGFTRRTVFHAPAFQQKGINQKRNKSTPVRYEVSDSTSLVNSTLKKLLSQSKT